MQIVLLTENRTTGPQYKGLYLHGSSCPLVSLTPYNTENTDSVQVKPSEINLHLLSDDSMKGLDSHPVDGDRATVQWAVHKKHDLAILFVNSLPGHIERGKL